MPSILTAAAKSPMGPYQHAIDNCSAIRHRNDGKTLINRRNHRHAGHVCSAVVGNQLVRERVARFDRFRCSKGEDQAIGNGRCRCTAAVLRIGRIDGDEIALLSPVVVWPSAPPGSRSRLSPCAGLAAGAPAQTGWRIAPTHGVDGVAVSIVENQPPLSNKGVLNVPSPGRPSRHRCARAASGLCRNIGRIPPEAKRFLRRRLPFSLYTNS